MNSKFYRVLNRFIAATDTWAFLVAHVVSSLTAAIVMAYFAIKLYPTLWVCVVSFLFQAARGVSYLSPLIVARRMEKSK